MTILTKKVKNCVRTFIDWGGVLTTVDCLLEGNFGKAFLVLLISGVAAAIAEHLSD